ncbi:uncharacterized protein H6S33_002698 [Morchella sextelata]|uniref:uncharacterized protein n=1 Tax=Morchella sextelata TaxID=1174677 RepID=UPI001D058133|nr:uncharacterized protein H6S33_002698 [Morchella sextelata]KAH0607664.1 hypothetical protein H6S33_002698 [Morchella sextelata]
MATPRVTASAILIGLAVSSIMNGVSHTDNRPSSTSTNKPLTKPWEQGSKKPLISKAQQTHKARAVPFKSQHNEPWKGSSGFPGSQAPLRGGSARR